MDDFRRQVRNGNFKRQGFDRNRKPYDKRDGWRKPKNDNQRRSNAAADYWPVIKKRLEKIGDSHRRLADAEERKADAMERIADCLNQLLKSSSENKLKEVPDIRQN